MVDSASNRNEYQDYFLGVKSGRCVRLTTLPPSYAVVLKSGNLNFLEFCGLLHACNETALPLPHWSFHSRFAVCWGLGAVRLEQCPVASSWFIFFNYPWLIWHPIPSPPFVIIQISSMLQITQNPFLPTELFLECLNPEEEGNTVIRNLRKY